MMHGETQIKFIKSFVTAGVLNPDHAAHSSCYTIIPTPLNIYRVIHKSLQDFRPLRYSSRDGHAEGEHVNRGRDTPNFCPTLQVLDMCELLTSEGS